jgi:hypothetical protein
MHPVEAQFEALRSSYPTAEREPLGDGSFVITVPRVVIPSGWTAQEATIRFLVPVGYPTARPDCFWADESLRLSNGQIPQNTGSNAIPGGASTPLRWYSWHLTHWSPNSDTLTTYVNVIRKRFAEAR